MAIAFDSAASGSNFRNSASSTSWSHTIGSGNNRVLIVGCSAMDPSGQSITSCTFNGVAMTALSANIYYNGTDTTRPMRWYYMADPPVGTYTVQFNLNTAIGNVTRGVSMSYTGVKTTSFPHAQNEQKTAAATSLTSNVTVSASGCWLVGTTESQTAVSSVTGGTQRVLTSNQDGQIGGYDSNGTVSTGTQGMTVNWDSSSYGFMFVLAMEPGGDIVVTPDAVALTSAILAPSVAIDVSVAPAVFELASAILAPSVVTDVTIAPAVVNGTFTVEEVNVITPDALVMPATVTGAFSLLAPTVGGGATISPATITATSAILAPTVAIVQDVTVTPSPVAGTFAILSPYHVGGVWTKTPRNSSGDWTRTARNSS